MKTIDMYNMKNKLAKILVALILVSGSFVLNSCSDDDNDDKKEHDTIYIWGIGNVENLHPVDKVKASADSVEVRYVILKSDERNWDGVTSTYIRSIILEKPFAVSPKVKGEGMLNRVDVRTEEHKTDSLWLVSKGFKFGELYTEEP